MKWDSGGWRATVPFRAAGERDWAWAPAAGQVSAHLAAVHADTHTPRFAAAARACGLAGGLWQAQWWWPAGLSQP